jgi:hypothetical protein
MSIFAKDPWVRSTPERRAGVLKIKLMIDEAHRLREDYDLFAYANIIANIHMALVEINPMKRNEISLEKSKRHTALLRSYGSQPELLSPNWFDEQLSFLDNQIKNFLSPRLVHFENILRLSFAYEIVHSNVAEASDFI